MDLSFQLYSSREVPSQTDFLSDLARIGYTQVEGFGGVYGDAPGFRAAMDAVGLTMPSGHFALADLENDFEGCAATADTLGIKLMIAPYLVEAERPTDAAGYKVLAGRLSAVQARAGSAGYGLAWHNHDFELVALPDGSIPLQILLDEAPAISWEADLAWVIQGGADAADWMRRYGARASAIHVKDIAPEGQNADEDGWADVGSGTVDWAGLKTLAAEIAPTALQVMEHDKPSDALRFARRSFAAYSKL